MIKKIYISWSKKPNERRYLIALLQRSDLGEISIKYLDDFSNAQKQGMHNIIGFGQDAEKLTSEQLNVIIRLRLVSKDKADKAEVLKFWEAEGVSDNFMLLALTQGKSPSDNFEFLGDFSEIDDKKIKFVTVLNGVHQLDLASNSVEEGDKLSFKREFDNAFNEIAVYKNTTKIGYVEKIHASIFNSYDKKIDLEVKSVHRNGKIKQIFIKVVADEKESTTYFIWFLGIAILLIAFFKWVLSKREQEASISQ